MAAAEAIETQHPIPLAEPLHAPEGQTGSPGTVAVADKGGNRIHILFEVTRSNRAHDVQLRPARSLRGSWRHYDTALAEPSIARGSVAASSRITSDATMTSVRVVEVCPT